MHNIFFIDIVKMCGDIFSHRVVSIVVSTSACGAEIPGSILGQPTSFRFAKRS